MNKIIFFSAALLLVLGGTNMLLTSAVEEGAISITDRKILWDIYKKFHLQFVKEKNKDNMANSEQYAVLYYGEDSVNIDFSQDSTCRKHTNEMIFLMHNVLYNYDYTKCPDYIAARIKNSKKHTERTLFYSLFKEANRFKNNYIQCPPVKSSSGNIYLFTYNSPCVKCCNNYIFRFAEQDYCGKTFNKLIIGFVQEYKNKYEQIMNGIKKDILKSSNIAITQLSYQLCTPFFM